MSALPRGAAVALWLCASLALAAPPIGGVRVGGGVDVRNSQLDGVAQNGAVAPQLRVEADGWFLPFLGVELELFSEVAGTLGAPAGVDGAALRFTGGRAGLATRYHFDNGFSVRASLGWGGASMPALVQRDDVLLGTAITSTGLAGRVEAGFERDRFQVALSGAVLVPVSGSHRVIGVEPRVWAALKVIDAGVSHWWLGVDGAALIETAGSQYSGVTARVGVGLRITLDDFTKAAPPSAPPPPLEGAVVLRVREPDGSPADGARVYLDGAVAQALDASGLARLSVSSGPHQLRVQREGLRVWHRDLEVRGGQELTLDVTLEVPTGPGRVTGTVFDAKTLKPIANARALADGREARSGQDGRFSLEQVGPGPVRVQVEALGFTNMEEVVQVPPEGEAHFSVAAEPIGRGTPAVIRGLVRSRAGEKLVATVRVQGRDEPVALNQEGRFELKLAPGAYTLTVTAPGHVPQARRFELAPGEQAVFHCELLKQ